MLDIQAEPTTIQKTALRTKEGAQETPFKAPPILPGLETQGKSLLGHFSSLFMKEPDQLDSSSVDTALAIFSELTFQLTT